MQWRHVVTCFLLNPTDGTVLLGRRSDRVSTYAGRWAAVSGTVEACSPVEQACREIEEETGLAPSQVELRTEGWPIRFADWTLGIAWVVHPFLFGCLAPEKVRRDWEHVSFQWTDPADIPQMQTVPMLREAYESAALLQGQPDSRWIFEKVEADRAHGAEELGIWTLMGLKAAVAEAGDGPAQMRSAMKSACREALSLRPSMAPVRSAALEAFAACRRAPKGAASAIAALIEGRERSSLAAAIAAAELIPDGAHVVTLSHSFTVLCTLREAADRIGGLTVAESRPACEGRGTARLAASFGIPTELVTDAAAARPVADSDLLLFGADALTADGGVVNKVGTFALCCAAARTGTSTLVVTTESKVLPAGCEPPMEAMPPEELGEGMPGVETRNVYFEPVPPELVGRIVAGGGVLAPDRLRQLAEDLRRLAQDLREEP